MYNAEIQIELCQAGVLIPFQESRAIVDALASLAGLMQPL